MINEQKLQLDIMRRVKTIYWGKLLVPPTFELCVLLALVYIAKTLVFWQAAIFNMSHLSINAWAGYTLGAFWHTGIIIKVVLIGLMFVAGYFVWTVQDVFRLVIKADRRGY